jgi:UDP-N-acetylmuramoylalanine-D-glutamate ligase
MPVVLQDSSEKWLQIAFEAFQPPLMRLLSPSGSSLSRFRSPESVQEFSLHGWVNNYNLKL